ncbi:MAG: peptidoglycan DD-metalloendopeptidase family protein [Ardenticatenaceae bacterium]|nr:peptidoglycan DD-metalloendopeptidase family protein [Ardenticatenaceae bacterium]
MMRLRLVSLLWLAGLLACAAPPAAVLPRPSTPTPLPTAAPTVEETAVPPATTLPQSTAAPAPVPSATPVPVLLWENPLAEAMQETAVAHGAAFHQLLPQNSGLWQFDLGSFWHPIALAMNESTAYLLDGGRVLALDLSGAAPPHLLLQPGQMVDGLLVQEPLDLSLIDNQLLVLDRAGGLYALDLATAVWQLEKNGRPIGETSSDYFVALGHDAAADQMRLRLESSYNYAQYFFPDGRKRLWSLPEAALPVDVSGLGDNIFVLWRNEDGTATAASFIETSRQSAFAPAVTMTQPRQMVATQTAVYILDQAGRRLLSLQPETGALQAVFQLPTVTAFASNLAGDQLLFAGRDQLFFWQQPEKSRFVSGGPTLPAPQPHDTAVWQTATLYRWPITGSAHDLTSRDLQMPGAPRHYRLGIHAGTDFYWANGTPVYAAAAGTVIRATLEYETPAEITFNRRRAENLELGYTAPDNLDFYRGRQIWILQDDGLVARYAHLSEIAWDIEEGTAVAAGQQIGLIGNTGSPASINSETEDAHLHLELWLDDIYFGQFLRPIEIRELLEQRFSQ